MAQRKWAWAVPPASGAAGTHASLFLLTPASSCSGVALLSTVWKLRVVGLVGAHRPPRTAGRRRRGVCGAPGLRRAPARSTSAAHPGALLVQGLGLARMIRRPVCAGRQLKVLLQHTQECVGTRLTRCILGLCSLIAECAALIAEGAVALHTVCINRASMPAGSRLHSMSGAVRPAVPGALRGAIVRQQARESMPVCACTTL